MKIYIVVVLALLLMFASVIALDENITSNQSDINQTESNQTLNETIVLEENITQGTSVPVLEVLAIIPSEFKIGDVQFNIQIKNNGLEEFNDVIATISGNGFATYDVVPIDLLGSGEKSYIIVSGNFKQEGDIRLTIRINGYLFYQNITVLDPNSGQDANKVKELEKKEAQELKELEVMKAQLDELQLKLRGLEDEYYEKKSESYDVSGIVTKDLKSFLRNAQSSLIHGDVEQLKVDLTLASSEYDDQKRNLDSARLIKRSFTSVIKDNAILITTLLGSIMAMVTFFELVKKKKEALYQKVKSMKIDKDTRVTIETKEENKEKKQKKK